MRNHMPKLLAVAAAIATTAGIARAETPDAEMKALAKDNNAFASHLYGRLRGGDGNLFFSPYSISTALAMTYAGARGETAEQMADALRFEMEDAALHDAFHALQQRIAAVEEAGEVRLVVANSLWPEQSYEFLPTYLNLVKEHYGASVTPLDYRHAAGRAKATINTWVEDRTRNKIKNLISSLDPLTRMVLVNAIYFKGNWLRQFAAKATEDQPFHTAAGKTVQAPLMTHRPEPGNDLPELGYREDDTLQVLHLPYVGEELAMVVLLPRKRDGLAELEQSLTAERLREWTAPLPRRKVKVYLPKFKMTWGTRDLTKPLAALGMQDAFSPAQANFSGMDGNKPDSGRERLYISQVLHKAFVEVNEEGTEAAAATAVVMRMTAALPQPTPTFRADHPFVFLICEKRTGAILFMGRVTDPTAGPPSP